MLFSAHDSFKNEGKKDEETQHLSHRIPTALQYECTRSTEPKIYFHFKKGVGFFGLTKIETAKVQQAIRT